MNPPFFNRWRDHLREAPAQWPDRRKGANGSYSMEDFGLSAFAVLFTQSPSFPAYQKAMRRYHPHAKPRAQGPLSNSELVAESLAS